MEWESASCSFGNRRIQVLIKGSTGRIPDSCYFIWTRIPEKCKLYETILRSLNAAKAYAPAGFSLRKQQLKSGRDWRPIVNMRIRPDELVAGFPAKQIRELLRKSTQFLSVEDVTKVLGLSGKRALRLLEALEDQGFIKKNTAVPDPKNWKYTIKGGAIVLAIFLSRPISGGPVDGTVLNIGMHMINPDFHPGDLLLLYR
jgi:hypothetical protein